MSIARGIRFETGRLVMLRSIDLNNEPLIETGEIDDKIVDRHLPAKMKPLRAQRPQLLP